MADLHTLPTATTTINFGPAAVVPAPIAAATSSIISSTSNSHSSTIRSSVSVSSSRPLPLTTSHPSPPNYSTYTYRSHGTAYSSGSGGGSGGDNNSPMKQNERNLKILFLVIGVLVGVIVLFFLLRFLKWFFFRRGDAERNANDLESQTSSIRYLDPLNPDSPRSESPVEIFEKPHVYHYTKRSVGSRSTLYE